MGPSEKRQPTISSWSDEGHVTTRGVSVNACRRYKAAVGCTHLVLDEKLGCTGAGERVPVPARVVEHTFTRSMGAAAVLDTACTRLRTRLHFTRRANGTHSGHTAHHKIDFEKPSERPRWRLQQATCVPTCKVLCGFDPFYFGHYFLGEEWGATEKVGEQDEKITE